MPKTLGFSWVDMMNDDRSFPKNKERTEGRVGDGGEKGEKVSGEPSEINSLSRRQVAGLGGASQRRKKLMRVRRQKRDADRANLPGSSHASRPQVAGLAQEWTASGLFSMATKEEWA